MESSRIPAWNDTATPRPNHLDYLPGAFLMVLILVGLLAIYGALRSATPPAASTGYTDGYTNQGGCLSNTPYDPARGAIIHSDTQSGQTVLTVVPNNLYEKTNYPSVLFYARFGGGTWSIEAVDYPDFDSIISSPLCVNNPSITK